MQTDWEKATKDHGSASVASMKVSMNNMYKKIEKAGGKLPEDGNGSGSGGVGSQAPATPASKKRKSKAEIMVDGEDGEVVETPKAKRGRPRKNATPKIVKGEFKEGDDEVKADGDEGVKEERAAEDQV